MLNVEKYYLIDQTEPLALAKKYLDKFPGISQKIIYVDAKEVYSVYKDIKKIDLFVASASVSELSLQLQDFYINNFIKRSTYSYILYSSTHFRGTSKFIEEKLNLLDKEFKVKVDNPYGRVLYIYLSKNLIADEVIGKNNDQFWKLYNSFYYNFIRFSRSLKEKLKRKILFN